MRTLFHGTHDPVNLGTIAQDGFDVIGSADKNSANLHGCGVYFSVSADHAARQACAAPKELRAVGVPAECKVVFCASVKTSAVIEGTKGELKPSVIRDSKTLQEA